MTKELRHKLQTAPRAPGVYIFTGADTTIVYIGKAADLRNRLASYLNPENQRNQLIITHVRDVDIIITGSDTEALTLEESLIKLHKPRYNVRLKDDKKFPYLKITAHELFPRIVFTRDIEPDGSLIFGPYTNARALRRTRDALCRIFKLVSCTKDLSKKYARPCLEHGLGRCCAPCTGAITKEDYALLVKKAIAFLNGNSRELEQELEKMMWLHADQENFEAARLFRDQLVAIRRISQRQHLVSAMDVKRDVIGVSRQRQTCIACLLRIRDCRLAAKEVFHLALSPRVPDEEIASAFIRLIYTHLSFIPEEIVVAHEPYDWDIQARWFNTHGSLVRLSKGVRGESRRLLEWATRNADSELSKHVLKQRVPSSILELQDILKLDHPPQWIEAFDISNIGERYAVGASVAFRDGIPYKQRYRHYRIKRVMGQNDFAMIHEIVQRRLTDLQKNASLPDLMLIDGGPGQMSAALKAFNDVRTEPIPIFALAKRQDELYDRKGRMVTIPVTSKSMYLLKRIRNEAHRFAVTYHRKVRGKTYSTSLLDSISGIGSKRKTQILQYFGSIEALKKASQDDIAKIPGIGRKTARIIYDTLHT
jgi:excinuclease ABC subunit C